MSNLDKVIRLLKSEKIKERGEGLASLRTVFARDAAVASLDHAGNGKAWLLVFQALFGCVLNEKAALTKTTKAGHSIKITPSAAASRRLGDAAATVRWLTERSVHLLNKKVTTSLIAHLRQVVINHGELLAPVALDYVKALRCVAGWTPHLEHMSEDDWVDIVQLAWNIVLGDPIRQTLDDGEGVELEESPDRDVDDDDMYMDDESDGDEGETTSNQSRKRRRAPSATPRPSSSKHTFKSTQQASQRKASHSHAPSLEQIECTALLATMLRFPGAPWLSHKYPLLASSLLRRFRRFLEIYPSDTSMHHDYVLSLAAALSQLSLNKKQDVTAFAQVAWNGLVGLWGTKNKRMKEGLVGVLHVLLPFYISNAGFASSTAVGFDCSEGIGRLFHLLSGEAESRWGIDGLSLDAIRLEIVASGKHEQRHQGAFQKSTFRAGWNFDATQALSWVMLQLQADCAYTLFQKSETLQPASQLKSESKRMRIENPITSLLASIQLQAASNIRAFHIQTLLFFIDTHWATLHDSLQEEVMVTLQQFVSFDDPVVQSWAFLCFAAIAYADDAASRCRDASVWDPIWTHAMRRANVPTVCRAACHAAHVLLSHWHSSSTSQTAHTRLLTSQLVLMEIEAFAKDMEVQGPSFPYDSVCVFLVECLRVSSKDVRLYKMQLEEKVIGWLIDCWSIRDAGAVVAGDQSRMPPHTVRDVLALMESACGVSKRSDLVCELGLPECFIVGTVVDDQQTHVIRNFLLHATLPSFHRSTKDASDDPALDRLPQPLAGESDLAPPRVRERRLSTFLLKSLEALISDWETISGTNAQPAGEKGRRSLDFAVLALSFEGMLVLNGTKATRRVVQASFKLLGLVIPMLTKRTWTAHEISLVIKGLDPLFCDEESDDRVEWVALVPPNKGTGIQTRRLQDLQSDLRVRSNENRILRRDLQRIIWTGIDAQEASVVIMSGLREVLRAASGSTSSTEPVGDTEDRDGFEPIRTNHVIAQSADVGQQSNDSQSNQSIAATCTSLLSVVPVLQSLSGEPTRDKAITDLVLQCSAEKFLLLGPAYFSKVHRRVLYMSLKVLGELLEKFEGILQEYEYSRSEQLQLLVTQFLRSTLHLWKQDSADPDEVGDNIGQLCHWLSNALHKQKIRSWRTRDVVIQFLQQYIVEDPAQSIWAGDAESSPPPMDLLPMLGDDRDVRIRFRIASSTAQLFSVTQEDPSDLYARIKQWLTNDIDDYEHMLTRMLTLGNVMIVSSAVRRAPYFHLLEGVFINPQYNHHVQTILVAVSERLGLQHFCQLFEAYASQIAFSIRQAGTDILTIPPHLLGYQGRRECAEATFRSFTPSNIMAGGSTPQSIEHGQRLFKAHCKLLQKSPTEGIRDCFGDIVGYQIAIWCDSVLDQDDHTALLGDLKEQIRVRTLLVHDQDGLEAVLQDNVDGIVTAILRTLADQDFTSNGAIVQALRSAGTSDHVIQAFQKLTCFRDLRDVALHRPNLPTYSTQTILRAVERVHQLVPDIDARATTYHVLRQLFADVQHTPLVNEQIRLINAISLWAALYSEDFKDLTLLHTLINGATSLLGHSDLARAAQSILDWCFTHYRAVGQKGTRLTDILVRICCIGHEYAIAQDSEIANMGRDILLWIDNQALQMYKISVLRNQVNRALPAWPHQPSAELSRLSSNIDSNITSTILNGHRISPNKFRLVRRFRDLALSGKYNAKQFAETDFWRLKESIPSGEQLQKEDVDAFAGLLALHRGRIQSFTSEQSTSQSLRARHIGIQKRGSNSTADDTSPQHVIVQAVLDMLDANMSSQVHVVYTTMRLIMSLAASKALQLQSWPVEYRTELDYLQKYPQTPMSRTHRDLTELAAAKFDIETTADFSTWISEFTILLSDVLVASDPFYAQITDLLASDVEFAEQVLPVLVHTVLQQEPFTSDRLESSFCHCLSAYFTKILSSESTDVSCLRCIVDVVLHLRNFYPKDCKDPLGHEQWLDVNYILLSRNAVTCGAYTTALLFLELAAEHQASDDKAGDVEQIMFDIYNHIDEPDGFYGIQTTDLRQFLTKRLHHEHQWEKALRFHGAAIEASSTNTHDSNGLLDSFHAFGFNQLAMETLQGSWMGMGNASSSAMSYKLGWRTDTWDLPDQHGTESRAASIYVALRAVHRERDPHMIDSIIWRALSGEMARLRTLGSENLTEIREVTRNLMCLNEVTQWRMASTQNLISAKRIDLSEWTDFVKMGPDFEFTDLEHIMATRMSLLRSVRHKEQHGQIGTLVAPLTKGLIDIEKQCLVHLSAAARESNQIQIALNSIVRAQSFESSPGFEVSKEFADVLWLQNERKLAVQYLKALLSGDNSSSQSEVANMTRKASLLSRLGEWTSEACLEKPSDISSRFFKPAITFVNGLVSRKDVAFEAECATVYRQCAMFAEHQYLTIVRSPDTVRWRLYIDRKTQEIKQRGEQLSRIFQGSKEFQELTQAQRKAVTLLSQDQTYFEQESGARNAFLEQAIDMYSRSLATSDAFDDDGSLRLCSLWFANFDDIPLQEKVRIALDRVPSRKFVFLAHQLSARLSASSSGQVAQNQTNVHSIISRMCQEHPFHSLYQVFALRANPGQGLTSSTRRQSSRHDISLSQTNRSSAADDIFSRLRGDSTMGSRVQGVENVCKASLQWAVLPIRHDARYGKNMKGPFKVPENIDLLKIKNLQVPVVTVATPIDVTLRYDKCIWIKGFEERFDTAGGVNLPKISVCIGEDGSRHKQLFKGEGNDDLRQDAVMEQVFGLVNIVLKRDRDTRKRELHMRDYIVIPLSSQAGILEFVGNTFPLADWVKNAHTKYRPTDMKSADVVKLLVKTSKECGGATGPMVKVFKEIMLKFQPVMRHYFTEKTKNPMIWYTTRLNYIRSVATASIVGHVLGLGDRHTSNILMDSANGAVVHIDLGIAFDQGKLLGVPERVPFRMTRDMVDGMGISGTQGVFQRCAEETLRVLRDRSGVIMTVLEVFKYDPLHSCGRVPDLTNCRTASDLKIKRAQANASTTSIDMSSGTADEAADRALSSVSRKLDKNLSVEYTVNELIAEATDIANLATIFPGKIPF
ncbi:hypothetical protein FIBSPDRAFT_922456 [Athelia psychrophila]|uniref:Serine/threonine-protein kinase Tel1 n=1 Tax=Athelia psychrophila TaxID=1759441 RepID=A0A165YU28_9AGAM|nr:hypothetical protein FIBSPDRAFT_922456 [Fibularhizoctonia sp. CBS 109695]